VFTITAVDAEGTPRTVGTDGFVVKLGRSDTNFDLAQRFSPTNLNNGRFALSYTVTSSGAYQMSVRLGNVWEITNAP
jgi:hypothetical protein